MLRQTRVARSITHQEFTITDYYYYSILQKEAEKRGLIIHEVDKWEKLIEYDTIVFESYRYEPFVQFFRVGAKKAKHYLPLVDVYLIGHLVGN